MNIVPFSTPKAVQYVTVVGLCIVMGASGVRALETLNIELAGGSNKPLLTDLNTASTLRASKRDGRVAAADIVAAAQADYTTLLETLYAHGYYSAVISIKVDGTEAALIAPLDPPNTVNDVRVTVTPGKQFRFGTAKIAPLAHKSKPTDGFASGDVAKSTVIGTAVENALTEWRTTAHAKARIDAQHLLADHATARLDAEITLDPGPVVTFGAVNVAPGSTVKDRHIKRIAGLPEGARYSPEQMQKAADRLRRTGTFRSVVLTEAETLGPGDTLDIGIAVVDETPRRFGVGAELSTFEGLTLSGYWLHRNFAGQAGRFRIDGEISSIGGQTGGIDYTLSARFERPAVLGPDTKFYTQLSLEVLNEPTYTDRLATLDVGASRYFSDDLTGDLAIQLFHSKSTGAFGNQTFNLLAFPASVTLDRRSNKLDARSGYYLNAEATPFVGLKGEGTGTRFYADARGYHSLIAGGALVLAMRAQIGAVVGPALANTPPEYLFFSGGGGTVRGQPYQSLNVNLGGGLATGGQSFAALSTELRAKVSDSLSLVGFFDTGYVGPSSGFDGAGETHSGAGIGARYDTVLGPLRFDVAGPLGGNTGKGLQVYIGIGQAF